MIKSTTLSILAALTLAACIDVPEQANNAPVDMTTVDMQADLKTSDMAEDMPTDDGLPTDMKMDLKTTEDMKDMDVELGTDMPADMKMDLDDCLQPTNNRIQLSGRENGQCVYKCAPGFADIDGNISHDSGCSCNIRILKPLENSASCIQAASVHVAPNGNNNNDGTKNNPVAKLAVAIRLTSPNRPIIRMMKGDYEGSVKITKAIQIFGGFDDKWSVPTKSTDRSTITGVSNVDKPTLDILYNSGTYSLNNLNIIGPDYSKVTPSGHGQNAITLKAVNFPQAVPLIMNKVTLEGGHGGHGADGADGADGTNGNNGQNATIQDATNPGAATMGASSSCQSTGGDGGTPNACTVMSGKGNNGQPGIQAGAMQVGGAGAGGDGGNGGCPDTIACDIGDIGEDGTAGKDGTTGTPGKTDDATKDGAFNAQGVWTSPTIIDSTPGEHGGGGGGGGAGGSSADNQQDVGAGGSGGSGGCGATPGESGKNGGTVIIMLLVKSYITPQEIIIIEGTGGNGGNGGNGGFGGTGGGGGLGSQATDICSFSIVNGNGGNGAKGGKGGDAPSGPGGNGGSVIGIATTHDLTNNMDAKLGNKGNKGRAGAVPEAFKAADGYDGRLISSTVLP